MARTAVKRSAWLIYNDLSFYAISPKLLPSHSAPTTANAAELSSLAAYCLIFNRGFCSNAKALGSGKINLCGEDKSHSELTALLKSYDFSEVQIDEIIQKHPAILSCKTSISLKPKIDYLVECGLKGSALHGVLVSNHFICKRSLESYLKPRYQFLKAYLMENANKAIQRDSSLLTGTNVETNLEYLEKQGVPVSSLRKLLANTPIVLLCSKKRLVELVEETKGLGMEPSDTMFVWHLKTLSSMSEISWKKKLQVFKSFGWSDENIRATLLHYPSTLLVSEEKLRKLMHFFTNNVKTKLEAIISSPNLLLLSLNGRIIPRHEVLKLLKEHNLLKSDKVSTFFTVPEATFIKRYVEKNLKQVPHLLQVYNASKGAKPVRAI